MPGIDKKSRLSKKKIWNHRGRTYFSPAAERRFYFAATIGILIAGILYKAGWL